MNKLKLSEMESAPLGNSLPNHKLMQSLLYGVRSSRKIPIQHSCDGLLEKYSKKGIDLGEKLVKTSSTQTDGICMVLSKHDYASELHINQSQTDEAKNEKKEWHRWRCGDCGNKINQRLARHRDNCSERVTNFNNYVKKQVEKFDQNTRRSRLKSAPLQSKDAVNLMASMREKIAQQQGNACSLFDGSDWSDYSDGIDNKPCNFPKETRNAMSVLMDGRPWSSSHLPPPPLPNLLRNNKLSG